MVAAFRSAFFAISRSLYFNLNSNFPIFLSPFHKISARIISPSLLSGSFCIKKERFCFILSNSSSSSYMTNGGATVSPSMEKQFEDFCIQLEESGRLSDRIRVIAVEMESAIRLMHSNILLVHLSRPIPEVLGKAKVQMDVLKDLFRQLAEILRECPGGYYRYHGDWRTETQSVVSLIAFLHWLDSGNLLMHTEVEEKLGLDASEFGLDIEDYLIGICLMSNELPRYVANRVIAGDYDCPRKVLRFLTDLHAAFRMLNLRNDILRKKFDGMKYDLRRVEEVYYDVKIRGLTSEDLLAEPEPKHKC